MKARNYRTRTGVPVAMEQASGNLTVHSYPRPRFIPIPDTHATSIVATPARVSRVTLF